ncbi:diacylglycerol kinase (ATP) [Schistosoma bovis]|uniref:Diacylglycerol kinase (ATP) n=1 Tax=Schistosoma bovis TaxID=6184 RepID=A0A430QDG9_SCHBO|nr:diacylglycerol kinase (ATP) [Schistosoma bovis]
MGLRKMVNRTKYGRQLDLPPLEGVIILNILSWGAGANPWGVEKDDAFTTPTHFDGQLEIVGVTGVVHMGQIFSGLRTGIRLAQGGHIRITVKCDIPVQVDGEPWIQPPGQIIVLRSALKATMLKKRKRRKVNRRHTEPGLGGSGSSNTTSSNVIHGSTEDPLSSAVFGASGPPPPESVNSLDCGNTTTIKQLELDIAKVELEEGNLNDAFCSNDTIKTDDSYPSLDFAVPSAPSETCRSPREILDNDEFDETSALCLSKSTRLKQHVPTNMHSTSDQQSPIIQSIKNSTPSASMSQLGSTTSKKEID